MTMLELKCSLFFSMSKMKNYKKAKAKARNTWTEEMLQEALHELDSVPGATIRVVAKKAWIRGVNNKVPTKKKKS